MHGTHITVVHVLPNNPILETIKSFQLLSRLAMTKNRLMVTVHSKDVPEILPLNRMTKFYLPPHFLKGLMHSFPMMYNTI